MLQKLKVEEVPSAVVITPDWPTAHWFPLILEMVINRPLLLPQCMADAADPAPVRAAESAEEVSPPSHVEFIRSRLEGEGISSRAATYILESWRAGTGKQYSAAWSCFTGWLSKGREVLYKRL